MSPIRRVYAAAVFAACTLAFAACSGGGDGTGTPSANSPTPTATLPAGVTPSATSAASVTPVASASATVTGASTPTSTVSPLETSVATPGPTVDGDPATPTPTATVPPGDGSWPAKYDLNTGESRTYTLQDGATRTLTLVSYQLVLPRTKTLATVRVEGGGRSVTQTVQVAHAGVPVAVNGLWVYGYAWKEADDQGFEEVARQGNFPLTQGKDVGFAVGDARYPFYPDLDRYTYPVQPPAAFHDGAYLQTWLDPDGWAHSGFDIGTTNGQGLVAIMDGYAWYQYYGGQGAIWVTEKNDQWSSNQQCWVFTHILEGSATVQNGAHVNKGDLIADSIFGSNRVHTHMGSCNSFDFGGWLFAASVWNNEHADDYPAPRHWLGLGAYSGDLNSNFIAPSESGALPADFAPHAGDTDRTGGESWRLTDNFVNSVVRVGEILSDSPFSGNGDRDPRDAVGYIATYIYSPADYTGSSAVHLKLGATRGARVWLNSQKIHDATEARYNSYDFGAEPAIVIDKYDYVLPLKQGWNTLIIKSDHGSRADTLWGVSPKIGDAAGRSIPGLVFSTRGTKLSAAGGEKSVKLSWSAVSGTGFSVDSYMIDIATDPAFNNLVRTVDAGLATSADVTGLPGSVNYFARVRPYNAAQLRGTTHWQLIDTATFRASGAAGSLPAQSPPNGLQPGQVPMFVLLGSDDNNRAGGMEFFVNAFEGRVNPAGSGDPATFDGEAAAMSFYLIGTNIYGPNIDSKQWRDQYMSLYTNGHEIGNHGFFGLSNDSPHGDLQQWLDNWMQPTQDAIERMFVEYGYTVADARAAVRGYRAAQDALNPAMYEAIKQMGYDYGNSSTTNHSTNQPAWWPGMLDDGWPGGPTWDDRDFGGTAGIWEVPQTYSEGSSRYCEKDWFLPPASVDGAAWRADMQATFTKLYNGNRAPLSLCLHSQEWGPANALAFGGTAEMNASIVERQKAMNDFLDWLLSGQFPDVRIVTHSQLLDWMKSPVPLRAAQAVTPTPAPTAQPVVTPTAAPPLSLVYSVNANRSNPVALNGQAVSGDIYVFTRPDSGVTRVSFYIDDTGRTGEPLRTESVAPFDLAGTNDSGGGALPFDTRQLSNGIHTITAAVTVGGAPQVFTGTLTVQNG